MLRVLSIHKMFMDEPIIACFTMDKVEATKKKIGDRRCHFYSTMDGLLAWYNSVIDAFSRTMFNLCSVTTLKYIVMG